MSEEDKMDKRRAEKRRAEKRKEDKRKEGKRREDKRREGDNIQALDRFDHRERPDKRERWAGEADKGTAGQE